MLPRKSRSTRVKVQDAAGLGTIYEGVLSASVLSRSCPSRHSQPSTSSAPLPTRLGTLIESLEVAVVGFASPTNRYPKLKAVHLGAKAAVPLATPRLPTVPIGSIKKRQAVGEVHDRDVRLQKLLHDFEVEVTKRRAESNRLLFDQLLTESNWYADASGRRGFTILYGRASHVKDRAVW
ncbi:hypothetical protein JCM11491_006445 [Sporobolomyces phaffii]